MTGLVRQLFWNKGKPQIYKWHIHKQFKKAGRYKYIYLLILCAAELFRLGDLDGLVVKLQDWLSRIIGQVTWLDALDYV